MNQLIYRNECHRFGVFEAAIHGPEEGNPFTEQWIRGVFHSQNETVSCDGFYDGDGIYRVRFMPSCEGEYTFCVESSFLEAGNPCKGRFQVTEPESWNPSSA